MKTTLEIPDQLYRQTKSAAALRGESVKDFVNEAVRNHLARLNEAQAGADAGWRLAFGSLSPDAVEELDRIVDAEFSRVEPGDW